MATCAYCHSSRAVGSRSDRGETSVTETSSSLSAAARAVERVRERRLRSATRFAIKRFARATGRARATRKKHFARGKKERLSATSDAIEPGAGGGRTSLPPWPSYTPKKAVSSSRPRTVACASCGRRPGMGSVSAGERGRGREILRRPRETFPAPDGCPKFRRSRRAGGGATRDAIDTAGDRYRRARVPPYSCATPASP